MDDNDQAGADAPHPDAAPFVEFGSVETRALSRIQQLTATFLHRNWTSIPHVTHNDLADVTDVEARRETWNAAHPDAKRTLLPYLVKAAVAALKDFPQFNASLSADGKTLVLKQYFNIGVAVDTDKGLLVPVLRNCDAKTPEQIGQEMAEVSAKARAKGLGLAEMSGGCFTISSLGHIGGTGFTPIINAPEVAILGVSRTTWTATRAADGSIDWRRMLPLSLSYDHRVINGADAARFTRALAQHLGAAEI